MSRYSQLLLTALLLPMLTFAQARLLTIEEATNMNPKLNAANLSQLQWRKGTGQFVYVAKNSLVQGSASATGRDTLVRLFELNMLLKLDKQFLSDAEVDGTLTDRVLDYMEEKNLRIILSGNVECNPHGLV